MFGSNPILNKSLRAPLEQGYHPELGKLELLDNEDTHNYQSLIGYLQLDISLGKYDIFKHVMIMSSSRSAPLWGHLDHVNRIYEYLDKISLACIRLFT